MLGYKISFLVPSCRKKELKEFGGSCRTTSSGYWDTGLGVRGLCLLLSGTKSAILVKSLKPFWVNLLRMLDHLHCTASTD